nr:immunoglobulin light chain junction region [Macaca mulatta]
DYYCQVLDSNGNMVF